MTEPNMVEESIQLAEKAIKAFCEGPPDMVDDRVNDEVMIDLLTDLMHFTHAEGIDFWRALQTAQMHYREERDGDR